MRSPLVVIYTYIYNIFIERRPWTAEETGAIKKHLGVYLRTDKVPKKEVCEMAIEAEPEVLQERTWFDVKHYVHDTNKTKNK